MDRPDTESTNVNYVSYRAPLRPLNFIKLPVGSIQPEGWVKKYLELQRDGLTGHLGEISAWLEKDNNAWLTTGGDHGWEEVPYWLKGYGNLAYILNDPKMIAETKTWIEGVFASCQPDGYFGPVNERNGKRELWAQMIMLWCLQSYYEYSQDQRVIDLMTNYFKWQMTVPDDKLLEDYWENSRGGDNIISIYWLYNHTGDAFLLDLAKKIHRNTADWTKSTSLPNWHNVNIAQCFREPATYYMQTGDSAMLKASYNVHHLIRRTFGQVPGGMFPFHVDLADSNTYFHRKTPFCKQIYKIFLQIAPAGIKNMEICKAGRQQREPGIQNGHTGRHPCGSAYGSAMKSNAGNRAQAAGGNRPKRTALRTTWPDNLSKRPDATGQTDLH